MDRDDLLIALSKADIADIEGRETISKILEVMQTWEDGGETLLEQIRKLKQELGESDE
jgi:hypothetical protein